MIKRLYNIYIYILSYTYQCDYFWLETVHQAREYPNLYRGSSLPVALVMSPAPKATRTDARNMQHLLWLVDTTAGLQRSWNQTLVTQSWSWSNCCHWMAVCWWSLIMSKRGTFTSELGLCSCWYVIDQSYPSKLCRERIKYPGNPKGIYF